MGFRWVVREWGLPIKCVSALQEWNSDETALCWIEPHFGLVVLAVLWPWLKRRRRKNLICMCAVFTCHAETKHFRLLSLSLFLTHWMFLVFLVQLFSASSSNPVWKRAICIKCKPSPTKLRPGVEVPHTSFLCECNFLGHAGF